VKNPKGPSLNGGVQVWLEAKGFDNRDPTFTKHAGEAGNPVPRFAGAFGDNYVVPTGEGKQGWAGVLGTANTMSLSFGAEGEESPLKGEEEARREEGQELFSSPSLLPSFVKMLRRPFAVPSLRSGLQFFIPGHVFDYISATNYWLRNFENPHQPKAVYLEALFINDAVALDMLFQNEPAGRWPDVDSGRAAPDILDELYDAVADQKPLLAMALANDYLVHNHDAGPLLTTFALAAGRFQNDPHVARMTMTGIEEYENNHTAQRSDIPIALAHYLAGYGKRTLALDCWELYGRYFVDGRAGRLP
jgi:hypothetical protein